MDKQRITRRLPKNTPSSATSSWALPAGKVSSQALSPSAPTPGALSLGARFNIGQIPISRPDQPDQSSLALPSPLLVQRKHVLGPASHRYEEEADRVADQVMGDLEQHVSAPSTKQNSISEVHPGRQPLPQPLIRRFSLQHLPIVHGTAVSSEVEQGIEQTRDQGQPLPATLRTRLEGVFHTDFHAVRIHTNEAADRLNRAIQARAFTSDNHIFFKIGEYQPQHAEGQRILAHELTHVIQQRSDPDISPDNSQGAIQQAQIAPIQRTKDKKKKKGDSRSNNPALQKAAEQRQLRPEVERERMRRQKGPPPPTHKYPTNYKKTRTEEAKEEADSRPAKPNFGEDIHGRKLWNHNLKGLRRPGWGGVDDEFFDQYARGRDESGQSNHRYNEERQRDEYLIGGRYLPRKRKSKGKEDYIDIDHKEGWRTHILKKVSPKKVLVQHGKKYSYINAYLWEGENGEDGVIEAYRDIKNLRLLAKSKNRGRSYVKDLDINVQAYIGEPYDKNPEEAESESEGGAELGEESDIETI